MPEWLTKLDSLYSKCEGTKTRILFSVATSFLLVCLYTFIDIELLPPNDDYGISLSLSGLYVENGPCLFVNALISQAVLCLNTVFPDLNWFFVFERLSVFLSLSLLTYGLLSYVKPFLALLTLCFVYLCLLIPAVTVSNFTYVGFFSVVAGISAVFGSVLNSSSRIRSFLFPVLIGTFFICVGFMWRREVAFLSLPCCLLLVIWTVVRYGTKSCRKVGAISSPMKAFIAMLIILSACSCLMVYDNEAWGQEGFAEWKEYNHIRATLSDYPLPDYEDISDKLLLIGVSENDYWMVQNWVTADSEVFDKENLAEIAASLPEQNVFASIWSGFRSYAKRIMSASPSALLACLCLFLCVVIGKKSQRIAATSIWVISFLVCSFFTGEGRLPERVEDPIWFYAIVSMVLLFDRNEALNYDRGPLSVAVHRLFTTQNVKPKCVASLIWGIVFCWSVISFLPGLCPNSSFRTVQSMSSYAPQSEIVNYMLEKQDNIFIIDPASANDITESYEYYYFPEPELLARYFYTGGWRTESPMIKSSAERAGIANILKGLVDNDRVLFISTDEKYANRLLTYLREHYSNEVVLESIDTVEDYSVYDYSLPTG